MSKKMFDQKNGYIKDLEETLDKFMAPMGDIPFGVVIKVLSGCKVVAFDKEFSRHRSWLRLLTEAATVAGNEARRAGIYTSRPNEVGNKIEPFVKDALRDLGLSAGTPVTSGGRRKATGYPDIEVVDGDGNTVYIECKTYNIKNINTTQRAFYLSPSKNFKITKDAPHLMLSFQIDKERRDGRVVYFPTHWKLYTLENLRVGIKHEFNQSNRNLYGSGSDPASLLAEGGI